MKITEAFRELRKVDGVTPINESCWYDDEKGKTICEAEEELGGTEELDDTEVDDPEMDYREFIEYIKDTKDIYNKCCRANTEAEVLSVINEYCEDWTTDELLQRAAKDIWEEVEDTDFNTEIADEIYNQLVHKVGLNKVINMMINNLDDDTYIKLILMTADQIDPIRKKRG